MKTGQCTCVDGYSGDDCSVRVCITGCEYGACEDGVCRCLPGYRGLDCNIKECPGPDCLHRGVCQADGTCMCDTGWRGDDCGLKACLKDCLGRGTCEQPAGDCRCDAKYTGVYCQKRACSGVVVKEVNGTLQTMYCEDHGRCNHLTGECVCDKGWRGAGCDEYDCPKDCSGHGRCAIGGICQCDQGWKNAACDFKRCPHACSMNGMCNNGTCKCFGGFAGDYCQVECAHNCSRRGKCQPTGLCLCSAPFSGAGCENACPGNCSEHGKCLFDGTCECYRNYVGESCDQALICPNTNNCSDHGLCKKGKCKCDLPWSRYDKIGRVDATVDQDCSMPSCPDDCLQRGYCPAKGGNCHCNPGFDGPGCGCPTGCGGNGQCSKGTNRCVCYPGFTGADCTELIPGCVQLLNCSGHGICQADSHGNAMCVCDSQYDDAIDCSLKKCPPYDRASAPCLGRGICRANGTCNCGPNWKGEDCSMSWTGADTPSPPNILTPTQIKDDHRASASGTNTEFTDSELSLIHI